MLRQVHYSINNLRGLGRAVTRYFSTEALKKTCLYDFHLQHGAKMAPFAGYSMPVQYSDQGIPASHNHTREHASIFDVSHMLQTKVFGKHRIEFMESLVVGDIAGLKANQGTLTLFTNEDGGILDDLIVTNTQDDYLYVVSNAGCSDQDARLMSDRAKDMQRQGKDVSVETHQYGLIAVQGPAMVHALQPGLDFDLSSLTFMMTAQGSVFGIDGCRISRCGYTGEDGVEISVPEHKTQQLTEILLDSTSASVKLAGLGARDSLRLEAGLCLYGSDISQQTSPVEATLAWTIGKRRRQNADFPGASIILQQLKDKPSRKRVGFMSEGPPARANTLVYDQSGEKQIGVLTSGCPSPTLKKNVSMGYVEAPFAKAGTPVKFEVRKKKLDAVVSKMPFVPAKYFMGK